MEFMDMGCLESLIVKNNNSNNNKLNESWIKGMLWQCLQQLDTLHCDGYIHNDIKPANILQNSKGNFRIADYGCMMKCNPKEFIQGICHGTQKYYAPEKFGVDCDEMWRKYDHKSDIWSLGIVVIECYLSFVFFLFFLFFL